MDKLKKMRDKSWHYSTAARSTFSFPSMLLTSSLVLPPNYFPSLPTIYLLQHCLCALVVCVQLSAIHSRDFIIHIIAVSIILHIIA